MGTRNEEQHNVRATRADCAFEQHEFGAKAVVEGSSGWTYNTPGTEMTKKVFIRFDDDDMNADTLPVNFTVVFKGVDSTEIAESFALNAKTGDKIGRTPVRQPEPPQAVSAPRRRRP